MGWEACCRSVGGFQARLAKKSLPTVSGVNSVSMGQGPQLALSRSLLLTNISEWGGFLWRIIGISGAELETVISILLYTLTCFVPASFFLL